LRSCNVKTQICVTRPQCVNEKWDGDIGDDNDNNYEVLGVTEVKSRENIHKDCTDKDEIISG